MIQIEDIWSRIKYLTLHSVLPFGAWQFLILCATGTFWTVFKKFQQLIANPNSSEWLFSVLMLIHYTVQRTQCYLKYHQMNKTHSAVFISTVHFLLQCLIHHVLLSSLIHSVLLSSLFTSLTASFNYIVCLFRLKI